MAEVVVDAPVPEAIIDEVTLEEPNASVPEEVGPETLPLAPESVVSYSARTTIGVG